MTLTTQRRRHHRPSQHLTQRFYEWEKRGRGWQVYNQPVQLEPPYQPFRHRTEQPQADDDGRRDTFVSRLLKKLVNDGNDGIESPHGEEERPVLPGFLGEESPVIGLQVALPPDLDITKALGEHLLLNLAYCQGPISFELVGTGDLIQTQFACRESDLNQLKQQLRAHFPDVFIKTKQDYLTRRWEAASQDYRVVVDFGLAHEFVRPVFTLRNFDADPLIGLVGALDGFEMGETGVLQVLFQPLSHPWAECILRSVTTPEGKEFFADSPEMLSLARQKISRPLYAAVVRAAASSPSYVRAWEIVRGIGAGLAQYTDPSSNEFIPLTNETYPDRIHETDLLCRRTRRCGMILNSDEVVSLVHLPSATVRSERLNRNVRRSKAAPTVVSQGELLLGQNAHNGRTTQVSLNGEQRARHVYVVGASGTGKSTFLLNLISQDIERGRGIALLDPHGDLVEDVIARVPRNRHRDVILFDPADETYSIGFNILSAHSELERNLIASDMVAVFRRLSTSWGDQMNTVLSNAVLAFLESDRGGTLHDLRRFLVEKEFRREFLKSVNDPAVVYYWEKEFPLLSGRPQGPILTRLDAFLRPKAIRYMVVQQANRLDFAEMMDSRKIFLAKLAQGAVGEENAYLLGTFLVSKFYQMTLSRQETQESRRVPFYLFIDEFHNFITPSMASILTSVRKYRLGLVLAHQELRQLEQRDTEVASAALSNPFTRVCFRVGESDARKLAQGLSYFAPEDLLNLGTGEAICRVERADYDFNLSVPPPSEVDDALAKQRRTQIKALSRGRYGTPVNEVEAFLETQWQKTKSLDAPHEGRGEPRVERKPPVAAEPPHSPAATEQVPAVVPRPRPARRASSTSTIMGKGGMEHKYLQQFIKRWAEGMGYRATIEKPLDGGATVDVALEKGDVSIACEIAVSTSPEHELGNLKKCLDAGFGSVITVSTDPAKLASVRHQVAEALSPEETQRVSFLSPEELFLFIEEIEADAASREHTVRGYKVKVKYGAASGEEKQARKRAVSQVLLGALSKTKRKK